MAKGTADQNGELTDLQLAFCREFIKDLNATQAYKRAGYKSSTDNSAAVGAWRLLRNEKIKAYLGEVANLSEAGVMSEIIKIAFANITDVISVDASGATLKASDEWSDRAKSAVESITVTENYDRETGSVSSVKTQVRMHDKLAALEKLMKKLKLYPSEKGVLELIMGMASNDLLVPGQAEVIADGLENITKGLRSLSRRPDDDDTQPDRDQ